MFVHVSITDIPTADAELSVPHLLISGSEQSPHLLLCQSTTVFLYCFYTSHRKKNPFPYVRTRCYSNTKINLNFVYAMCRSKWDIMTVAFLL